MNYNEKVQRAEKTHTVKVCHWEGPAASDIWKLWEVHNDWGPEDYPKPLDQNVEKVKILKNYTKTKRSRMLKSSEDWKDWESEDRGFMSLEPAIPGFRTLTNWRQTGEKKNIRKHNILILKKEQSNCWFIYLNELMRSTL